MFDITAPAKLLRVYDGDTIEVEVSRVLRLRLLNLWCPEIKGGTEEERRAGYIARNALADLLQGKELIITVPFAKEGKYGDSMSFGRILAEVKTADGIDVSKWMVEHGYGTADRTDHP